MRRHGQVVEDIRLAHSLSTAAATPEAECPERKVVDGSILAPAHGLVQATSVVRYTVDAGLLR